MIQRYPRYFMYSENNFICLHTSPLLIYILDIINNIMERNIFTKVLLKFEQIQDINVHIVQLVKKFTKLKQHSYTTNW